jgi:polyether ionophore transport system ATP-binding protein
MTNAIEARELRKSFGKTTALDGLDLTVRTGEVHAFLGPNGAGKSTTLRVLLGLLRKDGGTVELLGGDPWRDATELHKRIAYVPGDVTLWPTMTGGEIIDLLGSLRGAPGRRARRGAPGRRARRGAPGRRARRGNPVDSKRRQALIERFELDPSKKARAYSKGNRQKVALVAALASDAELLLLDEPTSGLDPLMEAQFRGAVTEEKQSGRTVLLSSHILSEAEALADRVTIIRAGRTVESGSLADLRHLNRVHVRADLADGTHVDTEVEPADLNATLARLTEAGVRSLDCRPPTLEEIFLKHYSERAVAGVQ